MKMGQRDRGTPEKGSHTNETTGGHTSIGAHTNGKYPGAPKSLTYS